MPTKGEKINMVKQLMEKSLLTKWYDALFKAIVLQAKIEKIVRKYKLLSIQCAGARNEIARLSYELDMITAKIDALKKRLNKF